MLIALLPLLINALMASEPEVRKPLDAYLKAHATGQGEYIRQAFLPDARISSMREGKMTVITAEQFASRFPGHPQADEAQRKRWIESIDQTGDAAVAKIVLDYPGIRLTDYMTLLKVDGEWKIVNKSFTAQPQPRP